MRASYKKVHFFLVKNPFTTILPLEKIVTAITERCNVKIDI